MSYSLLKDKFTINTKSASASLDGNLELRNLLTFKKNENDITMSSFIVPNTYSLNNITNFTNIFGANIYTTSFYNNSNINILYQVYNNTLATINVTHTQSGINIVSYVNSSHNILVKYTLQNTSNLVYNSTRTLFTSSLNNKYVINNLYYDPTNLYTIYNYSKIVDPFNSLLYNINTSVLKCELNPTIKFFKLLNASIFNITDFSYISPSNLSIAGYYKEETNTINIGYALNADTNYTTIDTNILPKTNYQYNYFIINLNILQNKLNWSKSITGLINTDTIGLNAKIIKTSEDKTIFTTYIRTGNESVIITKYNSNSAFTTETTILGNDLNPSTHQLILISISQQGDIERTASIIPYQTSFTFYTSTNSAVPLIYPIYEIIPNNNGELSVYFKNNNSNVTYRLVNPDNAYTSVTNFQNILVRYNSILRVKWYTNIRGTHTNILTSLKSINTTDTLVQTNNSSLNDIIIYNSDNSIYNTIYKDTSYNTINAYLIYDEDGIVTNISYSKHTINSLFTIGTISDTSYITFYKNSGGNHIYIDPYTDTYSINQTLYSYNAVFFRYNKSDSFKLFKISNALDKFIINSKEFTISDNNFNINSKGNVGIGTLTPLYNLHVNSGISYLNSTNYLNGTTYINGTAYLNGSTNLSQNLSTAGNIYFSNTALANNPNISFNDKIGLYLNYGCNLWVQTTKYESSSGYFGNCIAYSADMTTLSFGSSYENSYAGAIYIYTYSSIYDNWNLQQRIIANDSTGGYLFGSSIAISDNGNTLAVGSIGIPRTYLTVDQYSGLAVNRTKYEVGAVYIFTRTGSTWTQQAKLEIPNNLTENEELQNDSTKLGYSISLSSDGNKLVASATGAIDNRASPIEPTATERYTGAVFTYTRSGSTWTQQSKTVPYYVSDRYDTFEFGYSIAMTPNGNTLVVGSPNRYSVLGIVYTFYASGNNWIQDRRVTGSSLFGINVAISSDSSVFATSYLVPVVNKWIVQVYNYDIGTSATLSAELQSATESIGYESKFPGIYLSRDKTMLIAVGTNGYIYTFVYANSRWSEQNRFYLNSSKTAIVSANKGFLIAGVPSYVGYVSVSSINIYKFENLKSSINISANGSEEFKFTHDGNIGIGTTNPYCGLHIYSSNNFDNKFYSAGILLENGGIGEVGIAFKNKIMNENIWTIGVDFNSSNLNIGGYGYKNFGINSNAGIVITSDLNVGIGTTNPLAKLSIQGNVIASDDIIAFGSASDSNLKTNIQTIEQGLEIITKLRPVKFKWKDDIPNSYCNIPDYGFIAQEVEQIIPELTFTANMGIKYDPIKLIHYDKITIFLVKAIQEQQKQIDELYSTINLTSNNYI